ncbi:MAG TPA: hypothetical protein V6D12_14375 [Candidatus Obscuribacterales bacterium]
MIRDWRDRISIYCEDFFTTPLPSISLLVFSPVWWMRNSTYTCVTVFGNATNAGETPSRLCTRAVSPFARQLLRSPSLTWHE